MQHPQVCEILWEAYEGLDRDRDRDRDKDKDKDKDREKDRASEERYTDRNRDGIAKDRDGYNTINNNNNNNHSDDDNRRFSLPVHAFHFASQRLAQEALVRGSTDNIGVCVVDLLQGLASTTYF